MTRAAPHGTFARRLALWRILRDARDPLALRDLAGRLGVSKNTAQRDLDALSSAGIPVLEETTGQTTYYSVADGAPEPAPRARRGR